MKSIYTSDDYRYNEVGINVNFEAENFFSSILEKYPDYNPREMMELCLTTFFVMANRRILAIRREEAAINEVAKERSTPADLVRNKLKAAENLAKAARAMFGPTKNKTGDEGDDLDTALSEYDQIS